MAKKSMLKAPGKKAGMALPITLIVLLVAGALVALSFYFIENMMTTTKMKADDELRLNAALAGVERGKQWLLSRVDAGELPALTTTSGDIAAVTAPGFPELLVQNPVSFDLDGVSVEVRIFDLSYEFTSALDFVPGIPPRIFQTKEGGSIKSSQSYASSNAAEGDTGAADPDSSMLGSYLIRSEATLNELTKRVEQGILMAR
jgi:hypothetical protein